MANKIFTIIILSAMVSCLSKESGKLKNEQTAINPMTNTTIPKYTADYIAIRQLIDGYNDVVNHRSWDTIESIFSKDAAWEALDPINLKWQGLDDIKVKLPASVARMEVLIQTTSGIVIDVKDDTHASARSLLSEFGRNKDPGEGMHSVGSYEDLLIKENGNWKFMKRTLTLMYNDTLPVPGKLKDYKY